MLQALLTSVGVNVKACSGAAVWSAAEGRGFHFRFGN